MKVVDLLEQTLFVIVLYQRNAMESPAFKILSSIAVNNPSIFVYDNSPSRQLIASTSVTYIHDPDNNGVSRAYNEAYRYARRLGKKWLMLLDQDTLVDEVFLRECQRAVREFPAEHVFVPRLVDRVGLVSPFRWRFGAGRRIKAIEDKLPLSKYRFLNSGLLVSVDAFERAGCYDEKISLYFSDIAFGSRLGQVVRDFRVTAATVSHPMSSSEELPAASALHRYAFFCRGALEMGRGSGKLWLFKVRALLRGIKLSARYRDLIFIRTYFMTH